MRQNNLNTTSNSWVAWLLPLLLFIALAPWTPAIDQVLASFFYQLFPTHFQYFIKGGWAALLYKYGTWPAWIATGGFLILLILSFLHQHFKKWRTPALLFLLTFALGAGLIIHGLFKTFWMRPRPIQTVGWGGSMPFHPFWQPLLDANEPYRSFSCGHCTTGFVFFALYFIGIRLKNRKLIWLSLGLSFFLGIAMSLARMAQGGHYFSDVLASALIMWLTAYFLNRLLTYKHG